MVMVVAMAMVVTMMVVATVLMVVVLWSDYVNVDVMQCCGKGISAGVGYGGAAAADCDRGKEEVAAEVGLWAGWW